MNEFRYTAHSVEETDRLGRWLAEVLPPGSVIALIGTLGAGKTRLVQSVAAALGATEEVTSPTFVLVNEYTAGRMPVYHFDTYRLRDEDEFLELGPEEYYDSQGVTFIEWADRVERCLPLEYLSIHIVIEGENQRQFLFHSDSEQHTRLLQHLCDRLKA